MKKSYIVVFIILLVPCLIMMLNNRRRNSVLEYNMVFKEKLSEYHLFEGPMLNLKPSPKTITVEIASTLFTDYAEKQRIILLPRGQRMIAKTNGLPQFPDGTIIAKTFYYTKSLKNNKIVKSVLETRLLIKHKSKWNSAVYIWNDRQNEAYLSQNGKTLPITFIDKKENTHTTNYVIPSRTDCIVCHRQDDKLLPIGLKIRNMNMTVYRDHNFVNQLTYLKQHNELEISPSEKLLSMTDYNDSSATTEARARAYLNINCAHCHNPQGIAYIAQMDLRAETPFNNTGIWLKQGKIAMRMTANGELHMPKMGTSMPHHEGVHLILEYLRSLSSKKAIKLQQ